jgi:transposase
MPKVSFTKEFREQAVRAVMAERSPDESRFAACARLGPRLGVNATTLYNWVKKQVPGPATTSMPAGSVEQLQAENAALRKEVRELARTNDILQSAASFFGAVLDRQSKK